MHKSIHQPKSAPLYVAYVAYVASLAVIGLLLAAVRPSAETFGAYVCISFWALVGFDLFATQLRQVTTRSPFEDRFLGYLFAAPFIWPARMYSLYSRMESHSAFAGNAACTRSCR